jgi:hypothetical protein
MAFAALIEKSFLGEIRGQNTHNEAVEPWERHGMTKAWYARYARYATISNWEITPLLP